MTDMSRAAMREAAIEETKIGGDTDKAVALALIMIADGIGDVAGAVNDLADATAQLATEAGGIGVAVAS